MNKNHRQKPTMVKKKHSDLQPWLDYFYMLSLYVQRGFLQIDVDKHEVYVTQPAIHAMSDGNDPATQLLSLIHI